MKKRLLGFGFIGLAFVVTVYNITITGAVIGNSLSNFMGFVALVLFGVGGFLIMVSGLENKVVSSRLKEDSFLLGVAEEVSKRDKVYRDINHLIKELNKGNTNPGVGTRTIFKDIRELRGPNEGRVYFRQVEKYKGKNKKDKYEILAYSDKDSQSKVIKRLEKLYD